MDNDIWQAIYEVRRAIRVEGPAPQMHRNVMAKHRHEWPTLWAAIDGLLAAVEKAERGAP